MVGQSAFENGTHGEICVGWWDLIFIFINERNFSMVIEKMANDHDFSVIAKITFTSYKSVTSSNWS